MRNEFMSSTMFSWGKWGSKSSLSTASSSKSSVVRARPSSPEATSANNGSPPPELEEPERKSDANFNPTPYTFTVPRMQYGTRRDLRVECPPFHTLLDHTVAVVWILYSKQFGPDLGIVHLYWALSFLQAIRNQDGDTPDDIAMCVEAIQVRLAHMHSAVETFIDPKSLKLKSNLKQSQPAMDSSTTSAISNHQTSNDKGNPPTDTDNNYPVSIALKDMLASHPETLIELYRPNTGTNESRQDMYPSIQEEERELAGGSTAIDKQTDMLKQIRENIIANISHMLQQQNAIRDIMISLNKQMGSQDAT